MASQTQIVVPPYRVIVANDVPDIVDLYTKQARIDCRRWWSFNVIHRRGWGAYPGILIVPETHIAWIGAGERLLAYRLESSPVRLWTDALPWGSIRVEPPWEFIVEGEIIHLDNYGVKSQFPIATGPSK